MKYRETTVSENLLYKVVKLEQGIKYGDQGQMSKQNNCQRDLKKELYEVKNDWFNHLDFGLKNHDKILSKISPPKIFGDNDEKNEEERQESRQSMRHKLPQIHKNQEIAVVPQKFKFQIQDYH